MIFSGTRYKIPDKYVALIFFASVLPLLLNILGVDFGIVIEKLSPVKVLELSEIEGQQGYHDILMGKQVHSIFVSISIAFAIMTMLLALVDFSIRQEAGTFIVAMSLFCSGLLYVFHLLVSTRLISAHSNPYYLASFTWFFCRIFHASIISLGVIFFITTEKYRASIDKGQVKKFLIYVSTAFVLITVAVITYLFMSTNIPTELYPYRNIARPFELFPLTVYLFAALYLLPKFCELQPSVFSKALLLSMIPAVAAQLYMTFGSVELFDNNFNISHVLTAGVYFISFVGLSLNYLETHRREKKAAAELMTAEKFALTGRMARTLAHEVRNPLTNINLSVEQFRSGVSPAEESGKTYLDIIERNSKRINDLISEMLNISRPSELNLVPYDIRLLMNEALALTEDRLRLNNIQVEKSVAEINISLMLDVEKLRTALLNIIINAIEAMENGKGILKISTDCDENNYEIIIEDNGKGMDSVHITHIFEPFFTSKTRGTGLGLPSAKNIIDAHGGNIDVVSLPGRGTRFIISIPISE